MTSLYTKLAANVIFPVHEYLKHHTTVAVRRQLEDSQWWPRERLQALQLQKLRGLLMTAQKHVPYYRERFSSQGLHTEDLMSLEEFRHFPFLTKALIRKNEAQLKSETAGRLARFNTGGSSGEPLIFFIGRERVSHDVAAKWRATRWWGVDIGDPEIVVWGSPIELGSQDRIRAVRDRIMRTELLPAFAMSEQGLDLFVDCIRRRRPKMLFGYPSAISLIAGHAGKRGIALDRLGVKVVFVTAERLYDHQRAAITEAFGCPVANGYGSRDAGFIAHQCPAGGMHLSAEDIIVEIVDDKGNVQAPGVPGEIVVTHLATSDFPFIRYRTGDVAALGEDSCPCGRGLPLLTDIQGRSTDFVVAADGTVMHGLALIYVLRDLPEVSRFKIIQKSRDDVLVQIVPGDGFVPATEEKISAGLKARLGQSVRVTLEPVAEIAAEKSGKHRYVTSFAERN